MAYHTHIIFICLHHLSGCKKVLPTSTQFRNKMCTLNTRAVESELRSRKNF